MSPAAGTRLSKGRGVRWFVHVCGLGQSLKGAGKQGVNQKIRAGFVGLVFFPGNSVLELNLCEKRIHNFACLGLADSVSVTSAVLLWTLLT